MRVKKNEKNRKRYRTVAFRMSEIEWEELNSRVALCGRQKQDYLIDSVLNQKLIVIGNTLMHERIVTALNEIIDALVNAQFDDGVEEDRLLPIRSIAELIGYNRQADN